eukprot:2950544-Alexandrium_andersonii.AAC.1
MCPRARVHARTHVARGTYDVMFHAMPMRVAARCGACCSATAGVQFKHSTYRMRHTDATTLPPSFWLANADAQR